MRLIAVRVADVVLHVADDDILPVRNIQRTIVANLEVGRTQVAIFGDEQVVRLGAPDIALVIVFHRVLLDAKESDSV